MLLIFTKSSLHISKFQLDSTVRDIHGCVVRVIDLKSLAFMAVGSNSARYFGFFYVRKLYSDGVRNIGGTARVPAHA